MSHGQGRFKAWDVVEKMREGERKSGIESRQQRQGKDRGKSRMRGKKVTLKRDR